MNKVVFIDGEAGTTGLLIRQRLEAMPGVRLLAIDSAQRKDNDAKRAVMARADVVILCLHDAAAKESVAMIEAQALGGGKAPRVIDASSAHRTQEGWVYGFAELCKTQAATIEQAQYVSNPGCYPTGAIALLRPLVDAGLLPADYPIVVSGYSGYSGGGKAMIEAYELTKTAPPLEVYGLNLEHKHIPELQKYSKLTRQPIFIPTVSNFYQGMLIQICLHFDLMNGVQSTQQLEEALRAHYASSHWVRVVAPEVNHRVEPLALNGTNQMELSVYGNDAKRQAVLVAKLDNLGKGASGAAVQNLKLMLGLE